MSNDNRRGRSMREQSQDLLSGGQPAANRLSSGVRGFLLFTLGWSALSHFFMVAGIWDYEGTRSTFDVVMSTINVLLPIIGAVFIYLLYDTTEG